MPAHELKRLFWHLLIAWLLLFLLRIGFYLYFTSQPLPTPLWQQSLYIGAKFDLRLLLIIWMPYWLLTQLPWLRTGYHHSIRNGWRSYFIIAYCTIILVYFFDFGHYAYLEKRIDASVLRFTKDWSLSGKMLWQTYSLGWLVFALAGLYYFIFLGVQLTFPKDCPAVALPTKKRLISGVILLLLSLTGMWGKLSWYPLRWSDAFYSTEHFASQLALNPVLYFADTLKNQTVDYDLTKVRQGYPLLVDYLGIDQPDPDKLSFTRTRAGQTHFAHRPNLIIVLLESFAWYKTGLSGNPFNPTPHFDALAQQGISFNRYYAHHGGTARSVWSLITGLPDIEVNKTSTRNPLVVNQRTILNHFSGYEKFYFIGGSANWANIRGLLSHNIPGLNIYEEGSYTSPRMDVWGISDLHLFEEANQVLREQEKPFIALIQTSGNHRPYNIPSDHRGFEKQFPDPDKLARHGFRSSDDFNAMRFMDHTIGFFMRLAQQETYYHDSVFVFLSDHGNMRHAEHLPAYFEKLGLAEFQSPWVIYHPGIQRSARQIDTLASEIDILPTLAAYLSQDYVNTTLGRNMLDPRYQAHQWVFTVTFSHLPQIGLIGKDYYYRVYSDGSDAKLFQLTGKGEGVSLEHEIANYLDQLASALFHSSNYLRYHNAPAPGK